MNFAFKSISNLYLLSISRAGRNMEHNIKEQLINSVNAIKKKLKTIKDYEDKSEIEFKKILKPVTDPLNSLVVLNKTTDKNKSENSFNDDDSFQSVASDFDDDNKNGDKKYVNFFTAGIKSPNKSENSKINIQTPVPSLNIDNNSYKESKNLNIPYGIRSEGSKLMIGNTAVSISSVDPHSSDGSTVITVGNLNYDMTPGLKELLFQSKPNLEVINDKDRLMYKDILIQTNAHKRGFISSNQIQGNSSMKYCQVLKPLFSDSDTNNVKQGGSLPSLKKYRRHTDLVYWDDPNELVDRLKILIASKDAGNTNHDNEIISIIEELKEAGIIKA